ncbi:MAG TPA: D-2-hydroxyacid dehydrogenase [Anaerolineaceae bacterium]|nr:D-2-hydroxyacid dehydrogenase [Anaerolineaceae bacterium]
MNHVIEVLITVPFSEALLNRLREISPRLRINAIPARKYEEVLEDAWARCEILYTDRVLPNPDLVKNLRWIQFHYAGIDFAADHPLLHNPNLVATTLSGAAASQMAEFTVMMLLAISHRLPDLFATQARSEWPRDRFERFLPRELRGDTVGIIGYGSVGRQIARLLQPFEVNILAVKRDAMHPEDTGYIIEGLGDPGGDLFQRLYPVQALNSMLKECDFIVITIPLTPTTRNLIGAREFAAMKPGAVLIDISRGGVVDHNALTTTLQEKRLGGAALDVFPDEPLPAGSPLWKLPNVIITPHISGNSSHYNERAIALFSENMNRYLVGLPLFNRFDPAKGY